MLSLQSYLKSRHLISVQRSDIDDFSIQGFVVGVSQHLVALAYVFDFQVDGLLILRRSDITEVKRTATDEFQELLLVQEGIWPGADNHHPLELGGWRPLIKQLAGTYPLMIVEREMGPSPDFMIGRAVQTSPVHLEFHSFSGTGEWASEHERLKYAEITCVQVNTRYCNFYQRHFERDTVQLGS